MKKIISILLVMVLLAGCSNRNEETSQIESTSDDKQSVTSPASVAEKREQSDSNIAFDSKPLQETETSEVPAESSDSQPLTQKLIIPEGYTLPRIGMLLEDMQICTTQEFIDAAQNGDFSEFPLIAQQSANPNRCFSLEGYLYPDTYEIYSTDPPDTIIRRILANTEQKITTDIRQKITESGYTVDEIITLASIIEKEAFGPEPMPNISSVLHNRLEAGMRLQCDVTITYVEGAIKPFISGDINRYNEYYNTYKCKALPAGAICNPSLSAILAALSPADTPYLFFVTDADQNYYYSDTWEGHLENVDKAGIEVPS